MEKRLIDANVLIKRFKALMGKEIKLLMLITDVIKIIQEQPTIDQYGTWIPVTERLPGITGIYQVCIYDKECKRKRVWYGQFVYPRYWFVYDMSGDSIPCEITHWMPLPEPYREEKKDE